MESKQVNQRPSGGMVGSVLLGLLIGALLPIVAVFQISLLMPVLMLGGIFAAYLKAKAGWAPVAVLSIAALASSAWFLGGTLTLILTVASLLPALAVMRGAEQKQPFFDQMRDGVIAFGVGLLTAMLIAYASFGGGMVVRFVDLLRLEYNRMSDAALQPLADWMNTMVSVSGGQRVTVDYFRSQISGVLDLLQETYAQILPGTLLSGALLSGVLAVFWSNWTIARRGMATNESFVGMSGWFMPAPISLGAVALWAAGLVMLYADRDNGATVYMTISQLVGAAFAVQGLAAVDRKLLRSGRPLGRRRATIIILAVVGLLLRGLGSILSYVGVASALFGSRGAIKLWLQNRQNDHSDHDDPY